MLKDYMHKGAVSRVRPRCARPYSGGCGDAARTRKEMYQHRMNLR